MTKSTTTVPVSFRPPIVTVLGHVDHGKTTLLDTIRKTNIAAKEFGGITQHLGSYQVEFKDKKITFIDTPGHETFTQMRGRGTKVADIAVLVIAANDGVMPQTIESVGHIKTAKIPCIIVINKIDLPDVNIEKIKKQLIKLDLELEEFGGDIPVIPLSAKTGKNIDKLLEMILLLSELYQITDEHPDKLRAIVIESILSKNKGHVASVIVTNGKLNVGEEVVCDNQDFRIRAIHNWLGQNLTEVGSGCPAEILGWEKMPNVGTVLFSKKQVELSKPADSSIVQQIKPGSLEISHPSQSLEEEKIKIIIKADTSGTLEAILSGLPQNIMIIGSGVGNINESDVLMAKTARALIIGFHVIPPANVVKLAESEKVIIKIYNIIYELFSEISDVIEALRKGNLVNELGKAQILAIFDIDKQKVAGVKVISGRIARGDQIKIIREDQEIGRTRIKSVRHNKEDINKAEQGTEAGVLFAQNIDILTGDSIISIG